MPLQETITSNYRAWALWKVTETEHELFRFSDFAEEIPTTITNPVKRLEWLAGRVLAQKLVKHLGLEYKGIIKDEFGKPFLMGYDVQLSLTHSYPYVAALVDKHQPVGIDVEQPKEKLFKIATRVLDDAEQIDAGNDVVKHCIYWCAKEALVKIYGKKDLEFCKHLKIEAFSRKNEGDIIGKIIVGSEERVIPLYYKVFSDFVMVLNK